MRTARSKRCGFLYGAAASALALSGVPAAAQEARTQAEETRLEGVIVTGERLPDAYAGGQVARGAQLGVLGNRDVMDTPFNVQAYTSKLIADRQARGVGDILDNDPSARATWTSSAGYHQEEYTLRGVLVNNMDVTLNGLAGLSPAGAMPAEGIERLEVFKGPNAMLGGVALHGSLGGGINIVPKRAPEAPLTVLTGTFDSDSLFGVHADVGRRFGPDNAFGARVNGVYRNGDTAIARQSLELGFFTLGLDYRGSNYRLSLDVGQQSRDRDAPQSPVTVQPGFAIPKAPRAGANFQQSWAHLYADDTWVMARGEYDFAPNWTAYAAIGRKHSKQDMLLSLQTLVNGAGDFSQTFSYIQRFQKPVTGEVGVRGSFTTGAATHAVSLVGSALRQDFGAFNSLVRAANTNIYTPQLVPLPTAVDLTGAVLRNSRNDRASLAVSDIIGFSDDRLQLLLGARLQKVKAINYARTGEVTSVYDKSTVTPAIGVIAKPRSNVSIYANYIEGLTQPQAPGGSINATEVFAPLRTQQKEIGAKVDFGVVQATLSAFDITQPKTILDPASRLYSVDGEQQIRGVDLSLAGAPAEGLRLLGGLTLLDGEQTRTAGGVNQGKAAIGVADVQVNLGAEVDAPFAPGLTLTGLVLHTGRQYVDVANAQTLPAWTRLDLGVRYAIQLGGKAVTMRANVENVFDKGYWASSARDLTLGAPRTFKASVSTAF